MKIHDIIYLSPVAAYKKGYEDGISNNTKYPQTFKLLGYNLDELCDIINDWESRQSKVLFKTADERVKVEQVGDKLVVWADGIKIHSCEASQQNGNTKV